MKLNNKILVVISSILLLNFAGQCFAVANEDIVYSKDGINYTDKVYIVEKVDEEKFLNELPNEITINDNKYTYADIKIENQDTVERKVVF